MIFTIELGDKSGRAQVPSATDPEGIMLHEEVIYAVVFSGTSFASDAVGVALESAAIAAGLQQARSTITREMARNGWQPEAEIALRWRPRIAGGYHAEAAQQR